MKSLDANAADLALWKFLRDAGREGILINANHSDQHKVTLDFADVERKMPYFQLSYLLDKIGISPARYTESRNVKGEDPVAMFAKAFGTHLHLRTGISENSDTVIEFNGKETLAAMVKKSVRFNGSMQYSAANTPETQALWAK